MGKNSNSFLILLVIFLRALPVTALSSDDDQGAFEIFASSVFNSSSESEEEQAEPKSEPEKGENRESAPKLEDQPADDGVIICRFVEGAGGEQPSQHSFKHLGPLEPPPSASPLCPIGMVNLPKLPVHSFLARTDQIEQELLDDGSYGTASDSSGPTRLTGERSTSVPVNKQLQTYRETIFGAFGNPTGQDINSQGPMPLTSHRSRSVPLNTVPYQETIFGVFGEPSDELRNGMSQGNQKYEPPRKIQKTCRGEQKTSTSFGKEGKKQLQRIGRNKHFHYGGSLDGSTLAPAEISTLEEAYEWQGTAQDARKKTKYGTFYCFQF